ncbi:MAG TPA: DUF3159 domain-containing protein [Actinomycetales bacterium]|nr:DUF3159 domain-containing protein [Actinomycetales bacterium]
MSGQTISEPDQPVVPESPRRAARAGRAGSARGGLAAAGAEDFSMQQALGGPRGVVEAILPGLLFVVWFTVTRDLEQALVVSVGAAALAVVARLVTRDTPAQAISGLVGVGLCALVSARTGDARDFYLPGLLINAGYASVYAFSTIAFRSFRVPFTQRRTSPGAWPVIGLLIGPLTGEGLAWRQDPLRLRAYRQVTWMWVAMFLIRLAVQLPLYAAGLVGALGAARLAMGLPLFGLTAYLSWLVLRSVPLARRPTPVDQGT